MHILLSNDDGYLATGLAILAEYMAQLGQVTVVAPERNRSGASNSLTLDRPLSVKQALNGFFYVNGTPTDCVHIALTGLMPTMPDIVISGINDGGNMGDDTIYSGTVAAAMEGYLLDIPAIAVSMPGVHEVKHFATAAQVTRELVQHMLSQALPMATLLNVNVPDMPYAELGHWQITRLGRRHKAEPVTRIQTPRGETMYWVGAAGSIFDGGPGTDFYAVANKHVSISPIQVDLTQHAQLEQLRAWLPNTNHSQ